MIFILERFSSIKNRDAHFEKHFSEFEDIFKDKYEEIADELLMSEPDNSSIYEYSLIYNNKHTGKKEHRICKYNRFSHVCIYCGFNYSGELVVLTCFQRTFSRFKTVRESEEATDKELRDAGLIK